MQFEEAFFENYYLDEEEIVLYSNMNTTLYTLLKNKEIIEKSFKYLDNITKY